MIPVLYSENEKEFKTQGLGCLTDAISCKVTEERNGSFELEMQYPIDGIHYSDIAYSRIITAVPADGEDPQPFEIYRITRPLNGKVTVYAQHISYRLSYTVTLPSTKSDNAADALKSIKDNAVTECPFTFETDVVKAGSYINTKVQSIRSLLGGQTGSILDCFGGEYKWDKWNVKLCDTRGSTLPISLEYGKNLTDLQQEENIESTYTAVICTWTSSDETIDETVTGNIVYTSNHESFPYVRTLVVDKSSDYEKAPTVTDLTKDAEKYISANGVGIPKVSIKVSFVNLADTEEYKHILPLQHINLCDTIRVRFSKLGVNASAKVIKTVYDVLGEKYTSLEVGDARTSLVSTTAAMSQDIDETNKVFSSKLRSELKKQTDLITGGKGGYVVIRRDEETGYPDEILIMDQPDKLTAKNVIRMNKSGIGFSQSGYNGPFSSAWTIDSKFNADYIGAGSINANLIKSGELEDGTGNFYLDMATGKLVMKDGTYSGVIDITGSKTTHIDGSGIYTQWLDLASRAGEIWAPHFWVNRGGQGTTEVQGKLQIVTDGGELGASLYSTQEGNLSIDGSIYATGEGNFNQSDIRLKEDIHDISDMEALATVLCLNPVRYRFKKHPETVHHGFIAQEVKAATDGSNWGIWSKADAGNGLKDGQYVNYTEIIADLVGAIKALDRRIEELEMERK